MKRNNYCCTRYDGIATTKSRGKNGWGADLGWASTTKKSTKIDLPIRFDPKVDWIHIWIDSSITIGRTAHVANIPGDSALSSNSFIEFVHQILWNVGYVHIAVQASHRIVIELFACSDQNRDQTFTNLRVCEHRAFLVISVKGSEYIDVFFKTTSDERYLRQKLQVSVPLEKKLVISAANTCRFKVAVF